MKTIELKIKGMHCKSCTMVIGDALKEVKGVSDAQVSLEKNTAKVTFDDKIVKPEALMAAVKTEGYDARL